MAESRHAGLGERFRLAEVIAALSLATDLADGHPLEKALRTCLLAVELARTLGKSREQQSDVYYTSLLRFVGCTSFSHEEAVAFGGDDIATRKLYAAIDFEHARQVLPATLTGLARHAGTLERAKALTRFFVGSRRFVVRMAENHCETAMKLGERLGMTERVLLALNDMHERWDGRGWPRGIREDMISTGARVMQVANIAELYTHAEGLGEALRVVSDRAAGQLDPEVARAFIENADRLAEPLAETSVWDLVLAAEPVPWRQASTSQLDQVAEAFGDFADLKSIYTLGHSRRVATLAADAGAALGNTPADVACLQRAGHLHDLGAVSVPTGIWEKSRALSAAEWERIRLHPYYTERVLSQSPVFEPIARVAGHHHERIDGSGYHRNAEGSWLSPSSRILAAADVYAALTEKRPRPAHTPSDATRVLTDLVTQGRLDPRAVGAVLEAAGRPRTRTVAPGPCGLTEREMEVLRLVAQGASNKEVAAKLGISPRTVQHHVAHIYDKIEVSSRAGAALFAMRHEMLE